MPEKYHIPIKTAPPRFHPIGKYTTIEFRENCAGSCKRCVKKECVYGIFKENVLHMSAMEEPEYLYTCQSCFRCIQECTRGIFSRVINPDYRILGDEYWKAETIHRTWYQAHMGKIPVSGAGYRGPFVGEGFDSMWTDMSEIVRPTRDGIHGREYINTCFELSRRVTPLKFNEDMSLASTVPPILEVPIPLIFKLPDDLIVTESIIISAAKAATRVGTFLLISLKEYTKPLTPYYKNLIPLIKGTDIPNSAEIVRQSRAVALVDDPGIEEHLSVIREMNPEIIVLVSIPLDARAALRTVALAKCDVDSIFLQGDFHGKELDTDHPRFLKEMIREVHLALVAANIRQKTNLVFSGGIAMAEHMAKALICGADAVVADVVLLLALECRLCLRCRDGLSCPAKLNDKINTEWGSQRMVNLIGAWQNQLIEVMGAMGIREARRLRGEVGRSMWFEDLERENFGPIFGERKVSGLG